MTAVESATVSRRARIAPGSRVRSATTRAVVMSLMSLTAGTRTRATFWVGSRRELSITAAQMRRWLSSAAAIDRFVAASSAGVA